MKIKEGDKFILHSKNGKDYNCEVVNVNDCREPDMKYFVESSEVGKDAVGEVFLGDKFFEDCADIIEFKEG